ncbi:MAG TPA: murein biosynthesis integral membrane protein MurJ, partial [bacterium]|nr:murein biosynthesis integral membrane protein MurJ [bacterium]
TIPSTFRILFAEGALSVAFIPILSRLRLTKGEEDAQKFARAIWSLMVLVVGGVVVLAILTAPLYVPLLLNKWQDRDVGIELATQMVQIMFPFLFFISLSAWAMGILNVYGSFFLPAVSPAIYNVVVICGAIWAGLWMSGVDAARAMAAAVVIGGLFQFCIQVPALCRLGYFPWFSRDSLHPQVRNFLVALTPTLFGLAVYQINIIINRIYFASYLEVGSIATLTYAFRLLQFPQGGLGVAVSAAALPRLAEEAQQSSGAAFCATMVRSLRALILILIPSSVGLAVISHDLVGIVYNRGKFLSGGLLEPTTSALIAYTAGLFFFSAAKLLTQGFYVYRDVKTPVKIGFVCVVVNALFCCLLIRPMGVAGLALASTLSSVVQTGLLYSLLRPRLPDFPAMPVSGLIGRVLLCSGVMGWLCWLAIHHFAYLGDGFSGYGMRVLIGVSLGVFVYGVLAWLLLWEDVKMVLELRRHKE